MDPVERAARYVDDVLSGRQPACQWVRLAVERHVRDLERTDWQYRFDADRANSVCVFIEALPHTKGRWDSPTIILQDWQCFIVCSLFGWVDGDGMRRFRTAYEEVARKNGKSTKLAGVALYALVMDEEEGAEVYSAATTRDQARIVFKAAKTMAERSPELREAFGVDVLAHSVTVEGQAGALQALSADANSLDGLNVHVAVVDELHAHRTREVWEVLETGTGARRQPLVMAITTAGTNRTGICYEQRDYVTKILKGTVVDETYFGIIFTIDDDDDWTDPAAWAKANPNLNVSVFEDDLRRKCRRAMTQSSAQPGFLTKHLNVWVNADSAWLDLRAWDRCADPTMEIDEFRGRRCWIALDLASKRDVASKIVLFEDGPGRIALFHTGWLPAETIEDSDNDQYRGWEIDGHLIATPGNVIDFDEIEDSLREDRSEFEIVEVPYDPFQATQLATHLIDEGFPMVEYGATVRNFSEPMKELEALIVSGKVRHNGDPVLTWMMGNVVCHVDRKDNVFPRKERPDNKIDGAVAAIMAVARWMTSRDEGDSVYETRGIDVL